MASGTKTTTANPGKAVALAFCIHFWAWAFGSLILVFANALHAFIPPWFIIPVVFWGIAVGIHGFASLFIVDKLDGNFKAHVDTYIVKYLPKPLLDQIEAKLK